MGAARKPVLSKVWNDNKYPHTEKFQGQMVTIMPGSYLELPPDEAELLKGQFTPIRMFKGAPDPKFFKMLRVEHPEGWGHEEKFTCPVTGKNFQSAEELNESLKRFPHLAHRVPEDAKDAKIEALEAKLAALAEQMAELTTKRGRGRPRKDGSETEGEEHGELDS